MKEIRTKILGTGIYLPKKVLTNFDLEKSLDTSNEWIIERTGIKERRISSQKGGEFPADMAKHATTMALENAGMDKNNIEMIVFATATPDMPLPNSGTLLQTKLEITNKCPCFEVTAACSGFVYALDVADSFIRTGKVKNALVVGSEMLSSITNWEDRSSCILFGDACGVAIVGQASDNEESTILSTHLSADGTGKEYFNSPIGGAIQPITIEILAKKEQYMHMKGRDMFKVATRALASNSSLVLEKAGIPMSELDWLVPHQANIRIINKTIDILKFDPEKVIINIEKYGNTSSATIPVAFHEAINDKRIKRGDLVLFSAFGAGLTSGSILFRY